MINAEDLLELVNEEDVIDILSDLGSDTYKRDSKGNLSFTTVCHHGDSKKLQYHKDSGFFSCYTNCGSMSLFDLIMSVNSCSFPEAFRYVADYKGVNLYKRKVGLVKKKYHNEDLDFLNVHLSKPKKNRNVSLPCYDEKVLNMFDDYYPESWQCEEGISEDVAKFYGIKFYFNQFKVIIPHRDSLGQLVGIRSRNFLKQEVDAGRKYMPVTIQKLTYKYPSSFNLYGLYQNKENIKKFKRAILFESEKSLLKYASMYGQENNICLATLGMSLSICQRDMILDLGIDELVIAFDKQYLVDCIDGDKNSREYKEYVKYIRNLIKITKMFTNYCTVYCVLCWNELIGYKDSPIDGGKEVFEELYANRYLADVEEMEEMLS